MIGPGPMPGVQGPVGAQGVPTGTASATGASPPAVRDEWQFVETPLFPGVPAYRDSYPPLLLPTPRQLYDNRFFVVPVVEEEANMGHWKGALGAATMQVAEGGAWPATAAGSGSPTAAMMGGAGGAGRSLGRRGAARAHERYVVEGDAGNAPQLAPHSQRLRFNARVRPQEEDASERVQAHLSPAAIAVLPKALGSSFGAMLGGPVAGMGPQAHAEAGLLATAGASTPLAPALVQGGSGATVGTPLLSQVPPTARNQRGALASGEPEPGWSSGSPASGPRRSGPTGVLATLSDLITVCVTSMGEGASVYWPCCFPCRPLFDWWRAWGWGSVRPWLQRALLVVALVVHGGVVGSLAGRGQVAWACLGACVLAAGPCHWALLVRPWLAMWFRLVGRAGVVVWCLRCCTRRDMEEEPQVAPADRVAVALAAPSLASSRGALVVMGAWYGPLFGAINVHTALGLFANSGAGAWHGAGKGDRSPFVLSLLGAYYCLQAQGVCCCCDIALTWDGDVCVWCPRGVACGSVTAIPSSPSFSSPSPILCYCSLVLGTVESTGRGSC